MLEKVAKEGPVMRSRSSALPKPSGEGANSLPDAPYVLDDQVGFLLRQVFQRHTAIFADAIGNDITPMQWAAMSKLHDGPVSQNLLGRQTAMHAATIKGVIDRLTQRGLTQTSQDPEDRRRLLVALTPKGRRAYERARPKAALITERTLAPLEADDRLKLVELLRKML